MLLIIAGIVVVVPAALFGGYVWNNLTYADRDADAVADAGFVEKQVTINGSKVNYAEGPDNGPALLLIHGQSVDWRSWSKNLPALAERYHVFAVDCYGHGGSAHVPEKYTAVALAADLRTFLDQVVGEPATVAGHSSGGLIAAGIAAEAPELVRGLVLEDPPFFSTLMPRAKQTFNYVGLATNAHDFLASGEQDFVEYSLRHSPIWDLFGDLGPTVQNTALNYRADHPGEPVKIFYMPPSLNEAFRYLDDYDPRFGDTFYTGSFNDGFDHAKTLAAITVPVAQIHVKPRYDDNGVLQAATSDEEAQRMRSLLKDVEFYRSDGGHGFHFEDPDRFDDIIADLEARTANR